MPTLAQSVIYHDNDGDMAAIISARRLGLDKLTPEMATGLSEWGLTVFRMRGIFWIWADEGDGVGQFSVLPQAQVFPLALPDPMELDGLDGDSGLQL